ncbi:MAG: DUF6263 family protein [Mucilaginibacter sp.]
MKKTLPLLLLLPGFACFAQKVSLALNLQKDSTYYLKSNAAIQIKQNVQGQQVDVSTTITGNIAHKVLAVHDSVYSMQVSYINMRMVMKLMGANIEFGSDDKASAEPDPTGMGAIMSKMMKAIMNKPFLMDLSKTGHILSIKNIDVLFDGMLSELPQLPAEQKAQFRTQMEKSFGENSFKSSFQMAFPSLPEQKVGVNDKWTGSSMMRTTVAARINTTYILTGFTNNAVLVSGDGVVVEDKIAGPVVTNGITTNFTGLSGKITTEYAFDKHTGWVISAKTKESINGTVNLKMATGQEVTYPIEISGDVNVAQ